jgi:uncharacterized protein (DUF58 family)
MSRPHVVTSSELQSLRDLELVTRATVEGLRQGLHRSPFHGYSAEFSQYRHYRPGDDLRYVDWKAFARTDRVYTRQFRETTNLAALFVLDISRSMDFPQESGIRNQESGIRNQESGTRNQESGSSKFTLARTIAAILGTLVLDQGDAAGVLAIGDRTQFVPPRSGHHHLRVLLAELSRLAPVAPKPRRGEGGPAGTSAIDAALRQAATLMKRRGLVIAVSDFYEDEAAITQMRRLGRMGHDVIAIHVLSQEELSLDVGGAAEFVELETGRKLLVQPASAREAYAREVGAWLASVERELRRDGVDYLRVITGEPLEPALRRFLIGRGRRS